MSDNTPFMHPAALQQGLGQLLKCYSASGLKRFSSTTHIEVPADLLAQWTGVDATVASVTETPAPPVPQQSASAQSPSSLSPVDAQPAPETSLLVTSPEANVPSSPNLQWQLPNLDDDVRLAKFQALDEQVKACRKCPELVCYRRQTVFGEGNVRPKVCFFGEAPGADEDAQGRPFVGAAGKLLNDIIRAMKLTREEVYILNSLKCRPPQNRTPLPEEISNCRPFALTQLEILQPEFIVLLGAVAVRSVLQSGDSVGRLRGRFHHYHGARVVVTYHPAYLLRTPEAKKLAWADVQMVMRELKLI